jgi:hypothetical protein
METIPMILAVGDWRLSQTLVLALYNLSFCLILHITVIVVNYYSLEEELDSPAVRPLGVRSRKLSNALNGRLWDG